nr:phage GP46 family protein [Mesorhizobium sp.]
MRVIPLLAPDAPLLDPDIVWDGLVGDLAITDPGNAANPAGLRAGQGLATAVLICLMTDVRVEQTELRPGDVNRGWPGDGFDMQGFEAPLGSKLWLLRRRPLTDGIELDAEDYVRASLQTLIDQGACAAFDVTAAVNRPANRLDINIVGYGETGEARYDQRFAVLWDALDSVARPLDP